MSMKVAGAVLTLFSAGASAYSASEANKNVQTVDPAYQSFVNNIAQNDAQASDWASNLYQYGSINPYEDMGLPVTPYQNKENGKLGYFYDNKRGVYVDEQTFNHRSGRGNKALLDDTYKDENGEKKARFTFYEVQEPSTEGGYGELEAKKLATQHDMYGGLVDYANQYLAEERKILPERYAAEQAGINETVQTSEGKIAATNAANKYVVETTPYKTEADIAKFQYDKNMLDLKTPVMSEYFAQAMEGIDPKESMDSATAEVMKANDATKAGMQRDAMAMGIAPGSERYNAMMKEDRNQTIGAIADARTAARKQAEDTSFDRLSAAMNQG